MDILTKQDLAQKTATHRLLTIREKIFILTYLNSLSDSNTKLLESMLPILDLYLDYTVSPPVCVTLKLLSPHFSISIKQDMCAIGKIAFIVKPIVDRTNHYNSSYIKAINEAANTVAVTKCHAIILINLNMELARICWYDPTTYTISVQYLDGGGYKILGWDELVEKCK